MKEIFFSEIICSGTANLPLGSETLVDPVSRITSTIVDHSWINFQTYYDTWRIFFSEIICSGTANLPLGSEPLVDPVSRITSTIVDHSWINF